jgi:hypothetical protein
MQEAQLDDGVDVSSAWVGTMHQVPGLVLPQRRADGHVAVGDVADDRSPAVGRGLAQQAFLEVEAQRGLASAGMPRVATR